MFGKGYESFGHALLRSVKSTHILHFLLAFFTITTLDSHVGYWISLMWFASTNLLVSSWIADLFSSLYFLLLWATGLAYGSTINRWDKKSRSIPGISAVDQAKALMFLDSTSRRAFSKVSPTDSPTLNFLPFISISLTSPTGSGRLSRWSILGSASMSESFSDVTIVYDPLWVFKLFS